MYVYVNFLWSMIESLSLLSRQWLQRINPSPSCCQSTHHCVSSSRRRHSLSAAAHDTFLQKEATAHVAFATAHQMGIRGYSTISSSTFTTSTITTASSSVSSSSSGFGTCYLQPQASSSDVPGHDRGTSSSCRRWCTTSCGARQRGGRLGWGF